MEARAADSKQAARAIDALRRGWPIRLAGKNGALALLPRWLASVVAQWI